LIETGTNIYISNILNGFIPYQLSDLDQHRVFHSLSKNEWFIYHTGSIYHFLFELYGM